MIFDYALNTCRRKCLENQFFDGQFCHCSSGYKFYPTHNKCLPDCPGNLVYSTSTLTCVCPIGFVKLNGRCSSCPPGSEYNTATRSCEQACGLN